MNTIDAHCHLDQLDDPEAALKRAGEAGVARILAVSEDRASMQQALTLKRAHPDIVLAGIGIHPAKATAADPNAIEAGLEFISAHLDEADVLGEVGLDHFHADSDEKKAFQSELLDRMLEMAAGRGRPVNLHSRRAQRPAMERAIRFKAETGLNAAMHWFTASKKLIRICAAGGIFVSAGPSVIFDEQSRTTAATVPLDLLLVETDSPVPYGPDRRPAEPAWARDVTLLLAKEFGIDPSEFGRIVERNFSRYLTGRD